MSSNGDRKSGERPSRRSSEIRQKSSERKSGEAPSEKASRHSGGSGGGRAEGSKQFVRKSAPSRKSSGASGHSGGSGGSAGSGGSGGAANPYALAPRFSSHAETGEILVPAGVAIGVDHPSYFTHKPTRPSQVVHPPHPKPKKVSSELPHPVESKRSRSSGPHHPPVVARASHADLGPPKPPAKLYNKNRALIPPPTRTGQKTGIDMLLTELKITIPDSLPDVLKAYAKAAMRTQPPDLLRWSGLYFRSLAIGEKLPVKDRLEDPIKTSKDGLSPGILRVFDNILGDKGATEKLNKTTVVIKWTAFGLTPEPLEKYLNEAGIDQNQQVEWTKLVAVLAKTIGENLTETMSILCDVLTDQEEGKDPIMSYQKWWAMYTYLANLKGVSQSKIEAVNNFLLPISYEHSGTVSPRDFTTPKCPPLE